MPESATLPFDLARLPRLVEVMDALGYGALPPPAHAKASFQADKARVTVYASGKLLCQGKGTDTVLHELRALGVFGEAVAAAAAAEAPPEPAERASKGTRQAARAPAPSLGDEELARLHLPSIGSDEAGKGDYFGRLVVAACYMDAATWERLSALGVADSKRIADPKIKKLAAEIRRSCPHEVVILSPRKYNELWAKMRNVNRLLAWAHGKAICAVSERTRSRAVVVDRFASDASLMRRALAPLGDELDLTEVPRAEAFPAVAAASVLARAVFVEGIEEASERYGMTIPKGASAHVDEAARELVRRHGREALDDAVKLHFRTTERVLGADLFGAAGDSEEDA